MLSSTIRRILGRQPPRSKAGRPPVINDGDVIEMARTAIDKVPLVNQLIRDLNEGNLLARPPDYFATAVDDGRLVHARIIASDHVIGSVSFALNPTGKSEYELTGLVVHPGCRGFNLAGVLAKAAMVYHLGQTADQDREYIAHVLDGNPGPIKALTDVGFQFREKIELNKGALGGALDHTIQPGDDKIRGSAYGFDPSVLNRLIDDLLKFIENGGVLHNKDAKSIRVQFQERLIDRKALEYHREWLKRKELGNTRSGRL